MKTMVVIVHGVDQNPIEHVVDGGLDEAEAWAADIVKRKYNRDLNLLKQRFTMVKEGWRQYGTDYWYVVLEQIKEEA